MVKFSYLFKMKRGDKDMLYGFRYLVNQLVLCFILYDDCKGGYGDE